MRKILIVSILSVSFGCTESAKDANSFNAGNNNRSETPAVSPSAVPTTADKPTPQDEVAELKADFTGTSGIIDKKHDIRGVASLVDLRTGRHDGFDRIVFEFAGSEIPGYHLEYIDKPVRACGSGDVVPLAGDGWLQMRFEPARAHTDDGKAMLNFRELTPRYTNLLELKSTCDFEAQVEWVAGVASPNKYRVLELKNPTRLAVDIKHK